MIRMYEGGGCEKETLEKYVSLYPHIFQFSPPERPVRMSHFHASDYLINIELLIVETNLLMKRHGWSLKVFRTQEELTNAKLGRLDLIFWVDTVSQKQWPLAFTPEDVNTTSHDINSHILPLYHRMKSNDDRFFMEADHLMKKEKKTVNEKILDLVLLEIFSFPNHKHSVFINESFKNDCGLMGPKRKEFSEDKELLKRYEEHIVYHRSFYTDSELGLISELEKRIEEQAA